jgi:hypothetical protein
MVAADNHATVRNVPKRRVERSGLDIFIVQIPEYG